jgi:hypothetical protein
MVETAPAVWFPSTAARAQLVLQASAVRSAPVAWLLLAV